MKIGYFADGPWAHEALKKITMDPKIEIKFICLRYDTQDPVLRKMGDLKGIPVLSFPNINDPEVIKSLRSYECDLFVSMSFNQIFKKEIISVPPLSTINCHAGKLPFYRGRNILNWALINDEKEFGITAHYVDTGIDTGDIITQAVFKISDEDTYKTLLERSYLGCAEVLNDAVQIIQRGNVKRIVQNELHPLGFYCGQRGSGDELINWNQSSRELFNFIRAICSPGPRATTYLAGSVVKINKAKFLNDAPVYKGYPGQIIGKSDGGFIVKTLDSFIEIFEVEVSEGKKLKIGDRLGAK